MERNPKGNSPLCGISQRNAVYRWITSGTINWARLVLVNSLEEHLYRHHRQTNNRSAARSGRPSGEVDQKQRNRVRPGPVNTGLRWLPTPLLDERGVAAQ